MVKYEITRSKAGC